MTQSHDLDSLSHVLDPLSHDSNLHRIQPNDLESLSHDHDSESHDPNSVLSLQQSDISIYQCRAQTQVGVAEIEYGVVLFG